MADIVFPNILAAPPGPYSYTSANMGLESADNNIAGPTDFSTIPSLADGTAIMVFNSTGAPITLTLESNPDSKFGRSGSTAQNQYSIAAGAYRLFGPLNMDGWANRTTGIMRMQASATGLRGFVVRMI